MSVYRKTDLVSDDSWPVAGVTVSVYEKNSEAFVVASALARALGVNAKEFPSGAVSNAPADFHGSNNVKHVVFERDLRPCIELAVRAKKNFAESDIAIILSQVSLQKRGGSFVFFLFFFCPTARSALVFVVCLAGDAVQSSELKVTQEARAQRHTQICGSGGGKSCRRPAAITEEEGARG
jgi:hypothetical protein